MFFKKFHILFLLFSFFLSPIAKAENMLEKAERYAVRVKASIGYPFAEDDTGTFNGAGFLIDKKRGWFLTNAHVSGRGTGDIEISFKSQDFNDAKLVYVDPELDFSILSLETEFIPDFAVEAELDCSTTQLSGTEVAAFGHPHDLYFSASRGIISKVRFYGGHDWVQLDAAINPGNSGGPLIDLKSGKIVGINAMSLKDSEGLNFAVPLPPVCKAISLLSKDKNPSPPKLPISFAIDNVHEEYLTIAGNRYGKLPEDLKIGDVVLRVNETDVKSPTEVATELRGVGGKADFTILRQTKKKIVSVSFIPKPLITERPYLFVDGAIIADDFYLGRHQRENNFMFHSVRDGSYADRVGFSSGEIIISIDGIKPRDIEHLKELLDGEDEKQVITRHWSSINNQFYDFYLKKYSPGYIELY
jgi:S1-C subfamily serine protease